MSVFIIGVLCVVGAEPAVHTKACAHRGDKKNAPENTVPAFESAVRKGAHQIEFDVYLSSDGKAVIIHDATVDRTTNGSGKVEELTFDELRALDAGSWFDAKFAGVRIPTLRETLEVIPRTILCNVHLKNAPGVAEAATRTIVEMERLDHCFLACTIDQAETARAIEPKIRICNMSRQGGKRDLYVAKTLEIKADFIQFLRKIEGLEEAVKKAHAQGVKANFFDANDPEKMRALVSAGIDYILTDDLDTCLKVLAEYGVKPVEAGQRPTE